MFTLVLLASWLLSGCGATSSANWNRYRNDTYGYEVRYPAHWSPQTGPNAAPQPPAGVAFAGDGAVIDVTASEVPYTGEEEDLQRRGWVKQTLRTSGANAAVQYTRPEADDNSISLRAVYLHQGKYYFAVGLNPADRQVNGDKRDRLLQIMDEFVTTMRFSSGRAQPRAA